MTELALSARGGLANAPKVDIPQDLPPL